MGLIEEKKGALKQLFQTNLLFKREGEGEKREKGGETRKMEADVVDTLPSPNPLYDKFG